MNRTSKIRRRAAAVLAMAGVATFGAVALAPAASASLAVDGPFYVAPASGVGGPVAFLVTEYGRVAVFYCDPLNWNKLHNVCQPDPTTAPDRF